MERLVKAFEEVRTLVASKFPEVSASNSWRVCSAANQDHLQSSRQYAHVGHLTGWVCFAKDTEELEDGHLYGVIMHEFGHLISESQGGSDTEEDVEMDADAVIMNHFNIEIEYLGDDELEYVDPDLFREAIRKTGG